MQAATLTNRWWHMIQLPCFTLSKYPLATTICDVTVLEKAPGSELKPGRWIPSIASRLQDYTQGHILLPFVIMFLINSEPLFVEDHGPWFQNCLWQASRLSSADLPNNKMFFSFLKFYPGRFISSPGFNSLTWQFMVFIVLYRQRNLCLVGGGCVLFSAGQGTFVHGGIAWLWYICCPKKLSGAKCTWVIKFVSLG